MRLGGAASEVKPKFVSRSDPAAQWTGAHKGHAFLAYATNYLIDLDHAVIVDVEPARKLLRSIHEGARDLATTDAYVTSRRERKKVEMLFAHLKRILRLDRLRLRGPNGACDEFLLAATAQNLRKMAKLIPMPAPATAG